MKHQIINENYEKKKNAPKLDWEYERINQRVTMLVKLIDFQEKEVEKKR